MNTYNLQCSHIDLTDALQDYLEKRIGKVTRLADLDNPNNSMRVDIKRVPPDQRTGDVYFVKITVTMPGDMCVGSSQKSDLYASIDDAVDDCMRCLRKRKNSRHNMIKQGGRKMKDMLRKLTGWE